MSISHIQELIRSGNATIIGITSDRIQIKLKDHFQTREIQQLIDKINSLVSLLFNNPQDSTTIDQNLLQGYVALRTVVLEERKKLHKLLQKASAEQPPNPIPMTQRDTTHHLPSSYPNISAVSSHSPSRHSGNAPVLCRSEHHRLLEDACLAFSQHLEQNGLAAVRSLMAKNPYVAGMVFGKIWEGAGSPMPATHPQTAHPEFGKVAFFGEEGRSVPFPAKFDAVKAIRDELSQPAALPPRTLTGRNASDRITLWNDALKVINHGQYKTLNGAVLPIDTSRSVQGTKFYQDPGLKVLHAPSANRALLNKTQGIVVWDKDCLNAAEKYAGQGATVGVLNNATAKTPNGGIRHGTWAQEEAISTRTGLVDAIAPPNLDGKQTNHYPLPPTGGLYSPHVPVFREGAESAFALKDRPFEVGVMTVAACQNPKLVNGRLQEPELSQTIDNIYLMFKMAAENGINVPIVSAFGCGAYHNPPAHVAELFNSVIDSYFPNTFDLIVFAIIDDHNAPQGGNFTPFADHFAKSKSAQIIRANAPSISPNQPGLRAREEEPRRAIPTADIDVINRFAKTTGFVAFYDAKYPTPATQCFGNFYPAPLEFGGLHFQCAEAVYQAQKAAGDPAVMKQFEKLTGQQAFDLGRSLTKSWTPQKWDAWSRGTKDLMLNVLRAKFGQNKELQKNLLATASAYIVEHSPVQGRSTYWSDGHDGSGKNMLGELLMVLRKELGGAGVVPRPAGYEGFLKKGE